MGHLLDGSGAGVVVKYDAGGLFALRHLIYRLAAYGGVYLCFQLLIAERGIGVALHYGQAHIPIVGDVDFNGLIAVPAVLR